nr:MAG TPA: hypothetical protein [Caudoviricetes sp.]
MQVIPPTLQNSAQGFSVAFPTICPILYLLSGGASCYAVQLAPRWRAYQRTKRLYRDQIPPPRRTLYRSAQPPYYNKVYRGAAVRLCYRSMQDGAAHHRLFQPGGVSILPTPGGLQSGTGQRCRAVSPAHSTRRGSPAAGTRRATQNNWRLSPHLFSGFRPIANRGQQ